MKHVLLILLVLTLCITGSATYKPLWVFVQEGRLDFNTRSFIFDTAEDNTLKITTNRLTEVEIRYRKDNSVFMVQSIILHPSSIPYTLTVDSPYPVSFVLAQITE
jgi:hypothetical protein